MRAFWANKKLAKPFFQFKSLTAISVFLQFFLSMPVVDAAHLETDFGLYISIYSVGRNERFMTKKNPYRDMFVQYRFSEILKEAKKIGFGTIYVLPGSPYRTGATPAHRMNLPFSKQHQEWRLLDRDPLEEILSAADTLGLEVFYSGLAPFFKFRKDKRFSDSKLQLSTKKFWASNDFHSSFHSFLAPVVQDLSRRYGHHRSFKGIGTDEISYKGDGYFDRDPSMRVWGQRFQKGEWDLGKILFTEEGYALLNERERDLADFHGLLVSVASEEGLQYSTTVNRSMMIRASSHSLGGSAAIRGSDAWLISNLPQLSEVAVDFYSRKLFSHTLTDIIKAFRNPVSASRLNIVLSAYSTTKILFKEIFFAFAEGVDRITLWTDHFLFSDKTPKRYFSESIDLIALKNSISAMREFSKNVHIDSTYQVGILPSRSWARTFYRDSDSYNNEMVALRDLVDQINSQGVTYDILLPQEVLESDLSRFPLLVLPLGKGMESKVLRRVVEYVKKGGKLLCFGEVDMYTPWGDLRPFGKQVLGSVLPVERSHDQENRFAKGKLVWGKSTIPLAEWPRRIKVKRKPDSQVLGTLKGNEILPAVFLGKFGRGEILYSSIPVHASKKIFINKVIDWVGLNSFQPFDEASRRQRKMPRGRYDSYAGPSNLRATGRIYDQYWIGNDHRGLGIGYRKNNRLITVKDENLRIRLRRSEAFLRGKDLKNQETSYVLTTSEYAPVSLEGRLEFFVPEKQKYEVVESGRKWEASEIRLYRVGPSRPTKNPGSKTSEN